MHPIYFNERVIRESLGTGVLDGQTFAVKDVFALAGEKNSAGNPVWYETHNAATMTAPVVNQLLRQGAMLKGLTHTDELMYSLNGENIHFGTPPNPLHEEHIPGGSSSGSAAAAIERSFTIGTDTGGSVRVPASYCGLFGIRPTHGKISLEGVIPLAPSFDTVGWMSTSSEHLLQVGEVFYENDAIHSFERLLIDKQAWSFLSPQNREQLLKEIPSDLPQQTKDITRSLADWATLFRYIQGVEIWQTHGEWVTAANPVFAPAIKERFDWTSTLDHSGYEQAKQQQADITAYLQNQLAVTDLLVIPTTASVAPRKHAPLSEVEEVRTKTMQLTCIAGLAGFPQVTVPIILEDGLALGLSFVANKHCDRALLHFIDEQFGGKHNAISDDTIK